MPEYRFCILIDVPPERVFDLWTDLERMPEWIEGVTRVSDLTSPADQSGTRYTVWFGRMASRTEVLEVERPHRIRTRFGNALLKGEAEATFELDGNGTDSPRRSALTGWRRRSWHAFSRPARIAEASAANWRPFAGLPSRKDGRPADRAAGRPDSPALSTTPSAACWGSR